MGFRNFPEELMKCGGNIGMGRKLIFCGCCVMTLSDDFEFPQYLLRVYKMWGKCCCGDKVGIGWEK